ncbi:MAG: hypothetical protein AMJ73_04405 [candidate division Zixibacteria bacterium SM1_73]|nr:MAG: hypothetical protein AMJ73_04405 [candidate division Zixibacteria bacterium SM1_73]
MSFTNIDLVKKHIREHQLGTTNIENVSCQLLGETPFQLPHINLLPNSERVKGKEQNIPTEENMCFSSSDTISLAQQELIPDTVVVAKDSSLGQIYVENIDYSVDYDNGRLTRIPDGSIPQGAETVIWYLYFRIYTRDTDYSIDYNQGRITRIASGVIEDGQRVLADYTVGLGLVSDEVIANAVVEANDKILKIIDSSYSNSTDQSLVTAETYLAVSILCNIKALEVMTQNPGSAAKSLSLAWSNMSSVYRERAFDLLKKFRKDPGGLCSPYAARSTK